MKINLKISQRISLFVLIPTFLVFGVAIFLISLDARRSSYKETKKLVESYTRQYASKIEMDFNSQMAVVKTLSEAYMVYDQMPYEEWKDLFDRMYINVFSGNKGIYCIWDSWEMKSLYDTIWEADEERMTYSVDRNDDGTVSSLWENKNYSETYIELRDQKRQTIAEPYIDAKKKILMTSVCAPFIKDDKCIGLVGVDITLEEIRDMLNNIKPYEGSYAFMTSNKGVCIGHPKGDSINTHLASIIPNDVTQYNILEKIANGEEISYQSKDSLGDNYIFIYVPIKVSGTNTPWSLAIAVPESIVATQSNQIMLIALIIGIIGLIIISIIIFITSKGIAKPINEITNKLKLVALGKLEFSTTNDNSLTGELKEMSQALSTSLNGLITKTDFASEIGKGKLETRIELLSDDDILGKSLIDMRDSLIKAKEEENFRKIEDEKRQWVNEGVAKFADIIRQHNDLEILSFEIIKNLVNYLKANQGGLFIVNDENANDIKYDLVAAFAYDRKKYLQKSIKLGQGLLGQCAVEKESIYMTNVPQKYIRITSGLGDATPSTLLIVPLMSDEKVMGVLEIASFKTMDKHVIEFVEKVAEGVASALLSATINKKTQLLLDQTQEQSEEMQAQEEEMRQNMEEMMATQEETERREADLQERFEQLQEENELLKVEIEELKSSTEVYNAQHEYDEGNSSAADEDNFMSETDDEEPEDSSGFRLGR